MQMKNIKILFLLLFLLFFLQSGNIPLQKEMRLYCTTAFQPENARKVTRVQVNFSDSIPDKLLTIYYNDRNLPVACSRNIHTAVCIYGLCRSVDITLYWELTGKFLGYSVYKDNELTKRGHIPFNESDYAKLNQILSDPKSRLGEITEEEILPLKQKVAATDGRTGATIPNLSCVVVPEAAYSC